MQGIQEWRKVANSEQKEKLKRRDGGETKVNWWTWKRENIAVSKSGSERRGGGGRGGVELNVKGGERIQETLTMETEGVMKTPGERREMEAMGWRKGRGKRGHGADLVRAAKATLKEGEETCRKENGETKKEHN